MTQKRFILKESDIYTCNDVIHDNGIEMPQSTVCDLLNGFNDENKQLQHKFLQQEMEYATDLYRLTKENEQLKKENLDLSEDLDYYKAKCASLETGLFQAERETEQLRKENKELQGKASSWKITASEQIMEQTELIKENEHLKALLECSRKEANDYCEELMGKDEFIRLYKSQRDDALTENKQLQAKIDFLNDIDRNCYNCRHCRTYDEGPGYGFVSLCEKDCMNTDGYFDYKYHKFKSLAICLSYKAHKELICSSVISSSLISPLRYLF